MSYFMVLSQDLLECFERKHKKIYIIKTIGFWAETQTRDLQVSNLVLMIVVTVH
jgi:hypothetical protein